jgi:hypothetical protein
MLKIMMTGAMLFASSAFAQVPSANPANDRPPTVTNPGSPAAANSGPGSTGTVSTEATGAGNVSNNPAGAGNASQPERASSTPGSTK